MARSATPITLTGQAPDISFDELTTCLAEASAILWSVRQRRDERLAAEASYLSQEIPEQEGRRPNPKELDGSAPKAGGL